MSLDHVEIDFADEKQAALRSNLMTKGLSMGRDLTDKQIGKVKASKLVTRFGGDGQVLGYVRALVQPRGIAIRWVCFRPAK
jgi:hypothetical protein